MQSRVRFNGRKTKPEVGKDRQIDILYVDYLIAFILCLLALVRTLFKSTELLMLELTAYFWQHFGEAQKPQLHQTLQG